MRRDPELALDGRFSVTDQRGESIHDRLGELALALLSREEAAQLDAACIRRGLGDRDERGDDALAERIGAVGLAGRPADRELLARVDGDLAAASAGVRIARCVEGTVMRWGPIWGIAKPLASKVSLSPPLSQAGASSTRSSARFATMAMPLSGSARPGTSRRRPRRAAARGDRRAARPAAPTGADEAARAPPVVHDVEELVADRRLDLAVAVLRLLDPEDDLVVGAVAVAVQALLPKHPTAELESPTAMTPSAVRYFMAECVSNGAARAIARRA